MSQKLLESLPLMFQTHTQKAVMCDFLWTNSVEDPATIVYNLRLYDMIRRFYYVKTGDEPTPQRVLELIHFVKSNNDLDEFFMYYCKRGLFPDTNTLKLIKY